MCWIPESDASRHAGRTRRVLPAAFVAALFAVLPLGDLTSRSASAQNRTFGIDVSSWQGTVNWSQVKNAGVQFAFIRATRGGTTSLSLKDTTFVTNTVNARAQGIRTGAYHFARFDGWTYGDWTGPNSPADEARHFLSVARPYLVAGSLPPVLDIENDSSLYVNGSLPAGVGSNKFTRAQLTEWAMRFCEYIMADLGPRYRPLVYVNGSFANDELTTDINQYNLWFARYGSTGDPRTTGQPLSTSTYPNIYGVWNPTASTTNHPWAFWQYSSTGSVAGITGNVDLNVFNNERFGSIDAVTIAGMIPEPSVVSLLILPAVALTRRR